MRRTALALTLLAACGSSAPAAGGEQSLETLAPDCVLAAAHAWLQLETSTQSCWGGGSDEVVIEWRDGEALVQRWLRPMAALGTREGEELVAALIAALEQPEHALDGAWSTLHTRASVAWQCDDSPVGARSFDTNEPDLAEIHGDLDRLPDSPAAFPAPLALRRLAVDFSAAQAAGP